MRGPKWYVFRLRSKACSTREDLRRLKSRSEAALRNARNLYKAAVNTTYSAALQNLEGELKQTSAAHNSVCYPVNVHLANQHSETRGVRLAA